MSGHSSDGYKPVTVRVTSGPTGPFAVPSTPVPPGFDAVLQLDHTLNGRRGGLANLHSVVIRATREARTVYVLGGPDCAARDELRHGVVIVLRALHDHPSVPGSRVSWDSPHKRGVG